jgi:hypothetical protein
VAGPKPGKRPISPQAPAPKAKRPKKTGPKSKEVLSDTDVDDKPQNKKPKGKGKAPAIDAEGDKAKEPAPATYTDEETIRKKVSLVFHLTSIILKLFIARNHSLQLCFHPDATA